MPIPDKNKQHHKYNKDKYNKANSILTWMFFLLCVINILLRNSSFQETALFLSIVSIIFAVVSGYVAFLHSKLPKQDREKANWRSSSSFNIHPYLTFVLFVLLSVVGLLKLFFP